MSPIILACDESHRKQTRIINIAAAKAGDNLRRYLEEHRAAPETLLIIAGTLRHEQLTSETVHKAVPEATRSMDHRLTQKPIEQPDDLGAQMQRIILVIVDKQDPKMIPVLILDPERLVSFFRLATGLRFNEHENFNPGDIVALELDSGKYTSYHST